MLDDYTTVYACCWFHIQIRYTYTHLINSHKSLYRCIKCIVGRLYNSVFLLLIIFIYKFETLINILINSQVVVSLYWVYCWKIIQQCILVVDNFHIQIRYTYTHLINSRKSLYRCIECIVERLYNSVYLLLIILIY